MLEWVQYPEDTAATRTNYTYDAMYRLASAAATTDTGSALTASYTYTNDMLTQIQTGSTTYSFTYGAFAQRSGIQIGSRTLASYTYSNDQNRYLTQLDYGNGDYVQYTYDDQGRVINERFEDGKSISYSYDSTGALESVYDSTVYRNTKYSYDLSGRLSKYTESDTDHSVDYTYDELSNENLGALVYGAAGIDPTAVSRYFISKGYSVSVSLNTSKFDSQAKNNTANVLFYWHSSGAHNIAVRWNGREFIGYNVYRDSTRQTHLGTSLAAFLRKNGFWGAMLTSIS